MTRLARQTTLLALSALLVAPFAANAQESVEITPIFGYRVTPTFFGYDIKDSESYGFVLDVPLGIDTDLELLWITQESELVNKRLPRGQQRLFDVDVDYYQIGIRRTLDDDVVRPFFFGSAGLTELSPQGVNRSDASRFSLSFGGGVLIMPGEHIGLRLEGRGYATFINASGGIFCGTGAGCSLAAGGEVVWQGELSAGLTIVF